MLSSVSGENVGSSPAEPGERLVQDEAAREAPDVIALDFAPGAFRLAVMIVSAHVARDEGPCIDEDHFSSS